MVIGRWEYLVQRGLLSSEEARGDSNLGHREVRVPSPEGSPQFKGGCGRLLSWPRYRWEYLDQRGFELMFSSSN